MVGLESFTRLEVGALAMGASSLLTGEDAEGQAARFWEDSVGGQDQTRRRFGLVLFAKAKEARRAFWDLLTAGIEES